MAAVTNSRVMDYEEDPDWTRGLGKGI